MGHPVYDRGGPDREEIAKEKLASPTPVGCFGRTTAVHKNGGSQVQGHRPLQQVHGRRRRRRRYCRRRRRHRYHHRRLPPPTIIAIYPRSMYVGIYMCIYVCTYIRTTTRQERINPGCENEG